MGLFKRKKNTKGTSLSIGARDREIARLERERAAINKEIESLLNSYAKESGLRFLKHRKHRMGHSPNDYGYKNG